MLGRLIKHEWKSTRGMGCLMLGAMALVTVFGWLSFQTPMWRSASSGHWSFSWVDLFGVLTLVMYVILLATANFGILVYVGVHFYRTMYTEEGYLTHTLPATKHQLLISKLLVSSLWMCFLTLAMYLSLFLLGISMMSALLPRDYSLAQLWRDFTREWGSIVRLIGYELDLNLSGWLVRVFVMSMVTPFVSAATLFGAISIGQLSSKHKVLMSILSYIGINIVKQMAGALIQSVAAVDLLSGLGSYLHIRTDSEFIISLAMAVILYFVSWYINERKLNLD